MSKGGRSRDSIAKTGRQVPGADQNADGGEPTAAPMRLDAYLARLHPEWSRTRLKRLIEEGHVRVDGQPGTPQQKIQTAQKIDVLWPEVKPLRAATSARPLPPIIFEDEFMLVVDKPAGLVVHPAAGHFDGNTLVEVLLPKLSGGGWLDDIRPGLVHRLDRDTSGLILFAKTPEVQMVLSRQFAQRQVKKTYLALVKGVMESPRGTLECRIARHPGLRQRFAVSATGRWALTKFNVRETLGRSATLVELNPLTGRTHQLRVQLAAIGHPIMGDHVYGDKQNPLPFVTRHLLHAAAIEFVHPKSSVRVHFSSPPPADFQDALKLIRLNQ